MLNRRFNPIGHRPNRLIPTTPPPGPPPQHLWVPPSTPPCPPRTDSPTPSSVAIIGSNPLTVESTEAMDQTREFSSAPSTPTPKTKPFVAPSGEFSTNLPMPSLNSDIRLSPPIKRNKRRTFDEHSIESQEVINRSKSIQLLNTAKNALLESFVIDQNPETVRMYKSGYFISAALTFYRTSMAHANG